MQLARADRKIHLTYGTNVHPAESLAEVLALLEGPITQVRSVLGVPRLGLGLRLSAAAVAELERDRAALERLRDLSSRLGLYHFTLNAFPYGGFHAARVKEQVFEPPWFAAERVRYTGACASVLAELLPAGATGSISTLTGGFKRGAPADAHELLARRLLEAVQLLDRLREQSGRTIQVALEPEPFTTLETTAEVTAFFSGELFPRARAGLGARSEDAALATVRRHLGVCYDACHQAVQYEDPADSFARLDRAGIEVFKVQVSNALEIERPAQHAAALAQLRTFDEPRYLHQVCVQEEGGRIERLLDLPELFASGGGLVRARSLRVHFHVPLFWTDLDALTTTQEAMRATVRAALAGSRCNHFEVETYTWDVIPEARRLAAHGGSLVRGLAREVEFVRGLLHAEGFRVADD